MPPLFTGSKFGFLQNLIETPSIVSIDSSFTSVALLMYGDGTNTSTNILDDSNTYRRLTPFGNAQISTSQSKFTSSSIYLDGSSYIEADSSSDLSLIANYTIELWFYSLSGSFGSLISRRTNATNGWVLTTSGLRGNINGSWSDTQMSWSEPSQNTWNHLALVFTGTTLTAYVNGSLVATKTGVNTVLNVATNLRIGQADSGSENRFKGYMSNIRITKGARYSSNFSVPTSAFPNRGTVLSSWTPSVVTTGLWLDASDSSTITQSGGVISQWNDKSGNSRNFTQATSNQKPAYTLNAQNGLNVVTFDGINDYLSCTEYTFGSTHSAFVLFKYTGGSQITETTEFTVFNGSGGGRGLFGGKMLSAFPLARLSYLYDLSGWGWSSSNIDATTPTFASLAFNTYYNQYARINLDTAPNQSNGPGNIPVSIKYLATFDGSTRWLPGIIYEIVIVTDYLSTNAVARVEGYLAWKWGLVDKLPSTHLYKNSSPLYTSS